MAVLTPVGSVPVDPNWNFADAVAAANVRFNGLGTTAIQSRMGLLRTWGNVVGREAALTGIGEFVGQAGGVAAAGGQMQCSAAAVRRLRQYYLTLAPATAGSQMTQWLESLPTVAPVAVRDALVRTRAARELEQVVVDIASHEFSGAERGVVEELVLPALRIVIDGLKMDERLVEEWGRHRREWAMALSEAGTAQRILGYASHAATLTSGLDAFFSLIHRLIS